MSRDDDSNEREDRTVELSGIELRALRESAELTALTRSSVQKPKDASPNPGSRGLEEGTVPKELPDADDAPSKDPETKEIPLLVDEPPDPADISDPTRSIDRSSLKEMIKTEVKESVGAYAKARILRKGSLPANTSTETTQSGEGTKKTPSLAAPPNASPPKDAASSLEEETVLADANGPEALEVSDDSSVDLSETSSSDDVLSQEEEHVSSEPHDSGEEDGSGDALAAEDEPDSSSQRDEELDVDERGDDKTLLDKPAHESSVTHAPAPESFLDEPEEPRKKLGFSGVLVGLVLALVGGGAALMIPAFKAIGAGAALAGLAITFISALGMRD